MIEREAPGFSASPRTGDLPRLLRLVAAHRLSLATRNAGDFRHLDRVLDVIEVR
ncbi:MAG: hypothetical protein L0H64_02770 [Pseudonocardia sp.]|nr:hypothetical protein [Pseudonocardia sp.]